MNIITKAHGRDKIAQCIREIAEGKVVCKKSSNEFTSQEFNEALLSLYLPIPDPNLILYTGPLCCTHGLLPWHIRLSEFIQMSSDSCISVDNYINALCIYMSCNQRFGK